MGCCHPEPFDGLRTGSAEGSKALCSQSPPGRTLVTAVGASVRIYFGEGTIGLAQAGLRFLDPARNDIFRGMT